MRRAPRGLAGFVGRHIGGNGRLFGLVGDGAIASGHKGGDSCLLSIGDCLQQLHMILTLILALCAAAADGVQSLHGTCQPLHWLLGQRLWPLVLQLRSLQLLGEVNVALQSLGQAQRIDAIRQLIMFSQYIPNATTKRAEREYKEFCYNITNICVLLWAQKLSFCQIC